MKNYYKILEVDKDATPEEIISALKLQSKKLQKSPVGENQDEKLNLKLAHAILLNQDKREEYDRLMRSVYGWQKPKMNFEPQPQSAWDSNLPEPHKKAKKIPLDTHFKWNNKWLYGAVCMISSAWLFYGFLVLNEDQSQERFAMMGPAFEQTEVKSLPVKAENLNNKVEYVPLEKPTTEPVIARDENVVNSEEVTTEKPVIAKATEPKKEKIAPRLEPPKDPIEVAQTSELSSSTQSKTKEELLNTLGTPDAIIKLNSSELWRYKFESYLFNGDKLVAVR